MNVAFRVDASVDIGIGHVMRCLTLAEKFSERGVSIHFICRNLPGHLGEFILEKGFQLTLLERPETIKSEDTEGWLAVDWSRDVAETNAKFENKVDLLIVDHYGIDARWHHNKSPAVDKIMVIDDIANRELDCDILLDQTFKRNKSSYAPWLLSDAMLMLGTEYALLRPQFAAERHRVVTKRKQYTGIRRILVSFGGMDSHNHSADILDMLENIKLSHEPEVDIVLDQNAQSYKIIKERALHHKLKINVRTNVMDMAGLMFEADVAFGAGGSTSWERCVMALPTIMFVDAENQSLIATNLQTAGAVKIVHEKNGYQELQKSILHDLDTDKTKYSDMCNAAAQVCDGLGAERVVEKIHSSIYPDWQKVSQ